MKELICQAVHEYKIIAIVRGVEMEKCMQVAKALYDGGIRLMEITYDQRKPESWEDTAKTIGAIADVFEGKTNYAVSSFRSSSMEWAMAFAPAASMSSIFP